MVTSPGAMAPGQAALRGTGGRFVLVKPDRYVAAVFGPDRAPQVGAMLGTYFQGQGRPS